MLCAESRDGDVLLETEQSVCGRVRWVYNRVFCATGEIWRMEIGVAREEWTRLGIVSAVVDDVEWLIDGGRNSK